MADEDIHSKFYHGFQTLPLMSASLFLTKIGKRLSASGKNNDNDGRNDKDNAYNDVQGNDFAKQQTSQDNGREWLQRTEYGGRGGANPLDSSDKAQVGHNRTDECKQKKIDHLPWSGNHLQTVLPQSITSEDQTAEK